MSPTSRDEMRAAVKEIIATIKRPADGLDDIPDDAPLFDNAGDEPSPVALDSLDGLDLVFAIGERFGLADELDRVLSGEIDIQSLSTVNDIVQFIVAVSPRSADNPV